MRYLVKAKVKSGKEQALVRAIDEGTLGRGSIAGNEYLHNMQQARLSKDGVATWVECCFCATPLEEERPYWEDYFDFLSVKDAHSRRSCRHENGTEPWACCDCDCTKVLEERLVRQGSSFLNELRMRYLEEHAPSVPNIGADSAAPSNLHHSSCPKERPLNPLLK